MREMRSGVARRSATLYKTGQRRQSGARAFGAILALFALCLRLAWPAPPVPTTPDAGLLAALGEHALCLAAPPAEGKPDPSRDNPQPADHADHDGLGCCLWHAAAGFTLPRVGEVALIAFVQQLLLQLPPAAPTASERRIGPLQARAPPEAA